MKKAPLLFALIALLFLPVLVLGQQARFDEATQNLTTGEYRQALQVYESIAEEGFQSGALWLNMGVAYSHLDSLGKAKFYMLRAKQFPETKRMAEESLVYVEERLNRRSAVLPPLPWVRFFEALDELFGLRNLFLAGFLFLNMAAACWIGSWFHRGREKPLRYAGITTLGVSAFFFVSAIYVQYHTERYGTGVVIERQSQVFERPDHDASPVSMAYEGYELRVDHHTGSEEPGWHFVRLQNGSTGWIEEGHTLVF